MEAALTKGIASSIQVLLADFEDTGRPRPDTAIFYSISNCQGGLKGVGFGNFLIKQVVKELQKEVPSLRLFSTLSPVPGFRQWLATADEEALGFAPDQVPILIDQELDAAAVQAWRPVLEHLCARYLLTAKMGRYPLDIVARFQLRNGARLHRLNWNGDVSSRGIGQSGGILANYVYDLKRVVRNHEEFVMQGKIDASSAVINLAKIPRA